MDTEPAGSPRTVAEALGQVVWLLSQSAAHRHLSIADVESMILPAIVAEQFRIFYLGPTPGLDRVNPASFPAGLTKAGLEEMPLGFSVWGHLSEEAEAKVERGDRLSADEWRSGDHLWLLELVCPFANGENRLHEIMLADLMQGPFKDRRFSLHHIDPKSGQRGKLTLGGSDRAAA